MARNQKPRGKKDDNNDKGKNGKKGENDVVKRERQRSMRRPLFTFSSSSTLIFKIVLGRLRSRKELASRKTRPTAELKLKRRKIESN
jgi:hypothetical protein